MACNMPIEVVFLGHSFTRRLKEDIDDANYPKLQNNFGLRQCNVHFVHRGGWSILPNYGNFLNEAEGKIPKSTFRGRFKVAILQLGGNDMDGNVCPLLFASKLDDFVKWLESEYGIFYTYICKIFTRPQPRHCSVEQYEINRANALHSLSTMIADNPGVKIWKHRKIFNSPNNLFKRDGIHLNDCGTKKFYESIKMAIILAVEEFSNR